MPEELPYIRLYNDRLELYLFGHHTNYNALKRGSHLLVKTVDGRTWPMEVADRSFCGLSVRLILMVLTENVAPKDFIKIVCVSLMTSESVMVLADLLSTDSVPLFQNQPHIEIRP
jgi:hypothetical protein